MSKTLVICPIGLGNFIMATPALKALSNKIGSENLCLLALKPGIKQMAKEGGLFGEVFFWDPDKESMLSGIRLLSKLRFQSPLPDK